MEQNYDPDYEIDESNIDDGIVESVQITNEGEIDKVGEYISVKFSLESREGEELVYKVFDGYDNTQVRLEESKVSVHSGLEDISVRAAAKNLLDQYKEIEAKGEQDLMGSESVRSEEEWGKTLENTSTEESSERSVGTEGFKPDSGKDPLDDW